MIDLPEGFRLATAADCDILVELVVIASHGVALKIWADEGPQGADPRDVGAGFHVARAERGEIVLYDPGSGPVAGLTSFAVTVQEAPEPGLSPAYLPVVELEARAAPCWYILVLATLPEWRGKGMGRRLLEIADGLARKAGMPRIALVVADSNAAALSLYRSAGYEEAARAPMHRPGIDSPGTHWVLLVKPLA